MKAFRLIGMALVAMCLCMNFASCSNEDVVVPEEPQEEKYITVGLGCTGEFLEFSDSPLSRTTTEELYGIQVYALTPRSYISGETGEEEINYEETPYAYGMFTSLEDVKIRLLEGHKYKFEVSIVIEPFKNANLDVSWFDKNCNSYIEEFGNEFRYSINDRCNPTSIYGHEYAYDRYYGILDVYTPQNNSSVEIETKRVVYGVTYKTIGLDEEESFTIEVEDFYFVELDSEPNVGIYTFSNIWQAWYECDVNNEPINHSSNKKLTITWNKADGTAVPMGTYSVTFKRNVMTTIKIKAENLNMDNGIKVFKEEVSMAADENIYEIEGGTVTEVPVTSGN